MAHQVEVVPSSSPHIKAGQGNLAWGIESQKSIQVPGTGLDPAERIPTDRT